MYSLTYLCSVYRPGRDEPEYYRITWDGIEDREKAYHKASLRYFRDRERKKLRKAGIFKFTLLEQTVTKIFVLINAENSDLIKYEYFPPLGEIQEAKGVWEFYKLVGYDRKTKRYSDDNI